MSLAYFIQQSWLQTANIFIKPIQQNASNAVKTTSRLLYNQ